MVYHAAMASQLCWGCLSGLRQRTPWMALSFSRCQPTIVGASSFHTSAILYANPVKKKSNSLDSMPKFRTTRSVRVKKKKVTDRPRPPAVGERKALRKRIVLSNTNALEVAGMQDLSLETMIDSKIQGSVLGLPVPMLDQLRAVQAFKPSQGWSIFRRPATVLRRESLEMGRLFERISEGPDKGTTFRKIVTGLGGSGKSVHLLQAMAMGFLKKWVVITVPEPQDLVNAHTTYAPIPDTNAMQYVQSDATAALLSRIATANETVLSSLHISQKHAALQSALRPRTTLAELARLGVQDPSISWIVFQALWTELTATQPAKDVTNFVPRPPVVITVDGLHHFMTKSQYRSAEYKLIHAHDLVLVKHFVSLLQPGIDGLTLPNGGLILFATSKSNNPTLPTVDIALKQLAARQKGVDPSSPNFPRPDPYTEIDERAFTYLIASSPSRPSSAKDTALEVLELGGLSREEARGFMEYFARSGILHDKVTDEWVMEKWSLAGGGIVGEMEKIGRRLRVVS